ELFLPGMDNDTTLLGEKLVSRFGLRADQRDHVLAHFELAFIRMCTLIIKVVEHKKG
ncbi:MAG: initiator RepB protein, partial [Spirosoma sp.]|nr:initiator RepB protein [Spirosoma sp.]